jgi:hypothetical protein
MFGASGVPVDTASFMSGRTNDDLNRQLQQLQTQINQVNIYNRNSKGQEYMQEVGSMMAKLDKNEMTLLLEDEAFKKSKDNYEAAFMDFLSTKYNNEFLAGNKGEEAAKDILETVKKLMDKVDYANKVKQEKYEKFMAFLEQNPDILNQLESK